MVGVFGRFDLAALVQPHLKFICLFVLFMGRGDKCKEGRRGSKQGRKGVGEVEPTAEERVEAREGSRRGEGMEVQFIFLIS